MFSIKYSAKLLVNILANFHTSKIHISPAVITSQCRLFLQLLRIDLLLFFGNFRSLINLNIFLCLLMPLALLASPITYAANECGQKIRAVQPVAMSLNSPNNLAKYLADLDSESVLDLHYFLKTMLQLEADGYESSCIDGRIVVFNQKKDIKFYRLYHLLSQPCYQWESFGSFINYLIFNGSIKVITRPLLEVMLNLCDTYMDMKGMTIGNMLVNVEAQQHTDENISTFLHYKANDAKTHYKNFYNENDAGTKSSANKSSGVSWFSRYSQQLGSYTQRIAKNVSTLASKAMCKVPFIGALMSPVGALICDGGKREIPNEYVCSGSSACDDGGDEQASICCERGEEGIDSSTRMCANSNEYHTWYKNFFVCKNNVVIASGYLCDGKDHCNDDDDEQALYCCEGGVQGIHNSTRICEIKKKYNKGNNKFFVCEHGDRLIKLSLLCNNKRDCKDGSDEATSGTNAPCLDCGENNGGHILRELRCNGESNCFDGSDEQASGCCVGGVQGINSTTRMCEKSVKDGNDHKNFFVCKDNFVINPPFLCNGVSNCKDGSDEKALYCCKDGEQGIDGQRVCAKKGTQNTILFVCKNKDVILKEYLCDGNVTCVDGSDERINGTNPICFDCGENNGGYILSRLSCDGQNDCTDGSDENASYCCEEGEKGIASSTSTCAKKGDVNTELFVCGNMRTIQDEYLCDGFINCVDGSDELTSGNNPICLDCGNGNGGNILSKLSCDGRGDCIDGRDEKALYCCKDGERGIDDESTCVKKDTEDTMLFVCKNKDVILKGQLCDGFINCVDGSDELTSGENPICLDCGRNNGGHILSTRGCDEQQDCIDGRDELINGKNPFCIDCGRNNGGHILSTLGCDGNNDCIDGSDEKALYCCKDGEKGIDGHGICVKKDTEDTMLFVCKNKDVISKEYLCDGSIHCVDGSDERINGTNPICFDCGENNGGHIISTQSCDGGSDCDDGSDENASYCCNGGEAGIDNSTRICRKKDTQDTVLFVCKNMRTVQDEFRCNGNYDCNDGSDERINGTNPICFSCVGSNETFIASKLRCKDEINSANGSNESINGAGANALLYPMVAAFAAVSVVVIPIIGCCVYDGLWLRKENWAEAPKTRAKQFWGWCCGHKKAIDKSKSTSEIELSNLENNTCLKVDKNTSNKMDNNSESISFLQDNK